MDRPLSRRAAGEPPLVGRDDDTALQLQRSVGNRALAFLLGTDGPAGAQRSGEQGPAETAVARQAETGMLVVEDDVASVPAGALPKSVFLQRVHRAVCDDLEAALAARGRTTQGCPYLEALFTYYRFRSSAHIEETVRRYAPEASAAGSAAELVDIIRARVRGPVAHWIRTGEITGVPDDVPAPLRMLAASAQVQDESADVQRKSRQPAGEPRTGPNRPADVQARLGEGGPLDGRVRRRMEAAFGVPFGDVRVHADTRGAEISGEEDARAVTVGRDIAFGAGAYQPGTLVGDALIAHELAHVLQQGDRSAAVASKDADGAQSDALEEDADRAAVGAMLSVVTGSRRSWKDVATGTLPAVRSGLRLQRCKVDRSGDPSYSMRESRLTGQRPGQSHEARLAELEERYRGEMKEGMEDAASSGDWERQMRVLEDPAASALSNLREGWGAFCSALWEATENQNLYLEQIERARKMRAEVAGAIIGVGLAVVSAGVGSVAAAAMGRVAGRFANAGTATHGAIQEALVESLKQGIQVGGGKVLKPEGRLPPKDMGEISDVSQLHQRGELAIDRDKTLVDELQEWMTLKQDDLQAAGFNPARYAMQFVPEWVQMKAGGKSMAAGADTAEMERALWQDWLPEHGTTMHQPVSRYSYRFEPRRILDPDVKQYVVPHLRDDLGVSEKQIRSWAGLG